MYWPARTSWGVAQKRRISGRIFMQYENRKNWGGNGGKLMDVKQIMGERLVSLQMVFATAFAV